MLQPVAHALLQARDDVHRVVAPLSVEALWMPVGDAAPVGFHVKHIGGALDRLFTYARGEALNSRQADDLANERAAGDPPASAAALLEHFDAAMDRAFDQLQRTDIATLLEPRAVGRQALPSPVLGLLFHAAEHTTRHAGQIITTAKAQPHADAAVVRPIGVVRSSRKDAIDDDWDREHARIELAEAIPGRSLEGLDAFSHVEIIFLFHRVSESTIVSEARHPRGNPSWPKVGIFAQRGKARPNRLGATIARLVHVGDRSIDVAGLDAIDGTPVLDIKPVAVEFLPRGELRQPVWATELMRNYWSRENE